MIYMSKMGERFMLMIWELLNHLPASPADLQWSRIWQS